MTAVVHTGQWTREDRAAQPYRYLPVEVLPGAGALAVTLRYDRAAGVLDLGCLGPAGFRGWSGGARSAFAIGADRATPGYLPGPVEPGIWQVLLGLHRVGPDGLKWTVTAYAGRSAESLAAEVGADLGAHPAAGGEPGTAGGGGTPLAGGAPPSGGTAGGGTADGGTALAGGAPPSGGTAGGGAPPSGGTAGGGTARGGTPLAGGTAARGEPGVGRRGTTCGGTTGAGAYRALPARRDPVRGDLPAPAGTRWLAGDLHAHTVHSDGALTVPELAALAYARGLDFLAVTDHNTVSHHAELAAAGAAAGVLLLPGQEVTTDLGHANAFGDIGWVDFRQPADAWLAETERRGGILSINHPLAADCAWRQPMAGRPPLAEIWHWTWLDRRWGGPLAWWLAWHPGAVPVGGSDFHRHGSDAPPGSPTTWVACRTERLDGDPVGAVLDGLRAGRVAVGAGLTDPVLLRVDRELVAVGADGLLLVDAEGRRTLVGGDRATFTAATAADGPARLEDHHGAVVALCG